MKTIPVDIKEGDEVVGQLQLSPDTLVYVGFLPSDVVIRPWWPKRSLFRVPRRFVATWTKTCWSGYERVERPGVVYFRSNTLWTGYRPRISGHRRGRAWTLSEREVRKFKLPSGRREDREVPKRRIFTVQKLYGLAGGTMIMFQHEGQWASGEVGVYEHWREVGRVEDKRLAKVRKRLRRYLMQPTWLERVLGD